MTSIAATTAVFNDVAPIDAAFNATALETRQDATITVWIVLHIDYCQCYLWCCTIPIVKSI